MAFTDALFDGDAVLEGVTARKLQDIAGLEECWEAADVIPVTTVPESELMQVIRFDVLVDATMRRMGVPADRRALAAMFIGLGPGYAPGYNCHVAIETQWGESMGRVLRDQSPAERSGGPPPLAGVARERFATAPCNGLWRTAGTLGQPVLAGAEVGSLEGHAIRAPVSGYLRGLTRDGVQVTAGQRILEVDPRSEPQVFGLGERPAAIAMGVAEALRLPGSGES
jgi:xanthine dehydrogenase accessory factor